ncbi:MAG: flagellar hook-basal body complex protein FliE [Christensenellales bacterium]|jgi:flagellar hook-basal body complex protein FliE
MQVSSINPAAQAVSIAAKSYASTSGNFADMLSRALEPAENAENAGVQAGLSVLSGEDTEIHNAMIAMQKAELTLNLTIQVRNKVVEAYNEVMRMQV